MSWIYKSNVIDSLDKVPEGTFGFIYEITHIPSGRKYVGKKQLMSNRTLPPLKGEKRKRKVVKESDWKSYYGSHPEVKALVKESKEGFRREILQFVPTKKQLTYFENKYLFSLGVIEPGTNYINDNIEGRYFKKDFL